MKKVVTEKIVFVASDWTKFQNEESCRIYELDNQQEYIEATVYMHKEKGEVIESLINDGIVFDITNKNLISNLRYLCTEIAIKISINTNTWEYKILSAE